MTLIKLIVDGIIEIYPCGKAAKLYRNIESADHVSRQNYYVTAVKAQGSKLLNRWCPPSVTLRLYTLSQNT